MLLRKQAAQKPHAKQDEKIDVHILLVEDDIINQQVAAKNENIDQIHQLGSQAIEQPALLQAVAVLHTAKNKNCPLTDRPIYFLDYPGQPDYGQSFP